MTIRVSEVYGPVAQGEGKLLGERMPFLRVAGCNLACVWCDSAYTWQGEYAYTPMTASAVLAALSALLDASPGVRWVSITGGEPTLYRELAEVVESLAARDVSCIVETNGLHHPDWLFAGNVFVSCSPKLPGSGQDTPLRRGKVQRFVQNRMSAWHGATQWKFVIASAGDLSALPDYCASVGIPTDGSALIYVQPDGYIEPLSAYLDALRALQTHAPAWARVTPQVHRLIHGPSARSV